MKSDIWMASNRDGRRLNGRCACSRKGGLTWQVRMASASGMLVCNRLFQGSNNNA